MWKKIKPFRGTAVLTVTSLEKCRPVDVEDESCRHSSLLCRRCNQSAFEPCSRLATYQCHAVKLEALS
jgi:hypothetical protein